MHAFTPLLQHLLRRLADRRSSVSDERGASAVEYGLLVAGIAAVIVTVVFAFGQGVFSDLFQETCNSIGQNTGDSC